MAEYIDREALLHKIKWASSPEECVMSVRRMPAADVAPVRRGHWIEVREKRLFGEHYFLCSNCKSRNGLMIPFTYCPNCGAKMDG